MSNLVNIFYLHCPENINPQIYKACPPSQNNFLKTAEEPLQSRVSHKFIFHSCKQLRLQLQSLACCTFSLLLNK